MTESKKPIIDQKLSIKDKPETPWDNSIFETEIPPETLEEINNLSQEDKDKLDWGLKTIGFKVEEMKNKFFANTIDRGASRI